MSDSEDDFMSDKFLVEAPPKASTSTYSQRRSAQQLKGLRSVQSNNKLSVKQLEEQRRREGLSTSLFDRAPEPTSGVESPKNGESSKLAAGGGPKAMEMMMKMGWKVGQGLGRKRSSSPEDSVKRTKTESSAEGTRPAGRTEPIRVSLWAGRKGLSARSPSPPPLPTHRNPDALDPRKMARLTSETEDFRERQRRVFGEKEIERKEERAREMLIQFDREKGIKFHPLHVLPLNPLETLPRPLLRLIYPAQALSPTPSRSPSPVMAHDKAENMTAAERMREQIRRDMLSELEGDEDDLAFGMKPRVSTNGDGVDSGKDTKAKEDYEGVGWESLVSGTKRVLNMAPSEHLEYLLSQLRHEHFFCFWCAYRYSSHEEMEAPGGCPGPEEDDH